MFSSLAPSLPNPITANGSAGLGGGDRLLEHLVGDRRDRLPGLAGRELATGGPRHGFDELRLGVDGGRAEETAGEREDPVRVGHQQVGGERARGGEVREPPSRLRIGGERVGGRGPVPHRLRDPFQPDEGRIRVGGERERRRHHGEHVREDLADPRGGIHQPVQRLVRARRLREPEPGEQLLGRLAIVTRRRLDRTGERLEERPVEEPLVDPSDQLRRSVVLGLQGVGAVEPERARHGRARVPVGREVVGLEVAHHLQPVLQSPQEPVGVGEGLRILLRDVALVRERSERRERVGLAQP